MKSCYRCRLQREMVKYILEESLETAMSTYSQCSQYISMSCSFMNETSGQTVCSQQYVEYDVSNPLEYSCLSQTP